MLRRKGTKRVQAMMMAMVVLFSLCCQGLVVSAEPEPEGFCTHHTEHTAECGYGEAVEAVPCSHVHDETCGYAEALAEVPCDMACTDMDGDGVVDHVEGCAYQPAAEGSPCTHVHDASCGYVEGKAATPCRYAVEGCPFCVVSWEWVDEQDVLGNMDGSWGLGLPGAGGGNPLTREQLAEFLPRQIRAVSDNSQENLLDITWDLSALPENEQNAGEYTVTAALTDTQYTLTEGTAPLEILVQIGGAEGYALKLPAGDADREPYEKHRVYGVSPKGTTINLFDYWITSQTASDNRNEHDFTNHGINANHALLFRKDDGSYGDWNTWTRSEAPRQGIVQSRLGADGFPVLDLGDRVDQVSALHGRNGNESLAYLFDPDTPSEGKMSFKDVQGLLQVDQDGYYAYNCENNYAVYYPGSNSFALYDAPGVRTNEWSKYGQFFPFNAANTDRDDTMNTLHSIDEAINHYFGIHMSTRFVQQSDGHTDNNRDKEVTYEFSGDDDVWIFIDGILVADLGGIHNAASVKINFATGDIVINEGTWNPIRTTLQQQMALPGKTFANNTYHTLDFFYLERGNADSNMNLKYNLVTIPESSLIKVDQLGEPIPGAEFSLYAADNTNIPIATGTTNGGGEFVFLRTDEAGNSYPITIAELYDAYKETRDSKGNNLILKETKTPAGYRSMGDVGLYFHVTTKDEVLLLSNSTWDKGAYAMPKVTATTGNTIHVTKENQGQDISLVGGRAKENPLMFAVVFQKQDNGHWYPLSGDPIDGWHVEKDNSWQSILDAAKANSYIFQLASSGAYQVEIENLPGDIKTYYHICGDVNDAKYTVAYYYSEAEQLGSATEANTWRIETEESKTNYPLDRVFSMNLYVSNIKNRLLVQKVDEAGNTLNGAEFSLYKKTDVTVNGENVTVNPNVTPYDTLITANVTGILNLNGGGIFPTAGKVLENGEYYLMETGGVDGYIRNEKPIHIFVDDTGVYADAGTEDDGIAVLRGVGSVMRSMVQFAADDHVDTTLHNIQAALAQNVTFAGNRMTWEEATWNSSLHLQYENTNRMLDYGLEDGNAESTLDNLTLVTESGWSKLLIRQCKEHPGAVGTANRTDLTDKDLTNLFSGTVTVRVTNWKIVPRQNVTIKKIVTGNFGDRTKEFSFAVTCDQAMEEGTGYTLTNGGKTASFTLSHADQVVLKGIPEGAVLTIREENGEEYSVTVSADGRVLENGRYTVTNAPNQRITVTNHRDVIIDTGIVLDSLPYILLLSTAAVGAVTLRGRRRRGER